MKIYDAKTIGKWDEYTIQNEPISSIDLMERASISACKQLIGTIFFKRIHVVCGMGNNGGDGLAMARLLSEMGKEVQVSICRMSEEGSADFEQNLKRLPTKITVQDLDTSTTFHSEADVLVDCIFGSGLNRPVEGWLGRVIREMNESGLPIIAIDIPSGLFIGDNSNNPLKNVIQAYATFSFQVPKYPFLFARYEKYTGITKILHIGLSKTFDQQALATIITPTLFKKRHLSHFEHKGKKGFLSLIAGQGDMVGAAILSASAAFRGGCGYVGVYCSLAGKTALYNSLPEALYLGERMTTLDSKTKAIAIGPGLGLHEQSRKQLETVLEMNVPMVLDADALNACAEDPALLQKIPAGAILTPHLKELERLIGHAESPEDLLQKQVDFSVEREVYVIQKGAWSKLTTPEGKVFVNPTGNPGMGTAGMGDTLTGLIGGLLAQSYEPFQAAMMGVYYHGKAGDHVMREQGEIGILARDVIAALPKVINGL